MKAKTFYAGIAFLAVVAWIVLMNHEFKSVPPAAKMQKTTNSAPTVSATETTQTQISETETVLNKYGLTSTKTVGVTPTIKTNQ